MKWQSFDLVSLRPTDIVYAYEALSNNILCYEFDSFDSLIDKFINKSNSSSEFVINESSINSINILINVDLHKCRNHSIIGIQFLIELFCKLKRLYNDVFVAFFNDEQTEDSFYSLSHMLYPWCSFHGFTDKFYYVNTITHNRKELANTILTKKFLNVLPICQLSLGMVQMFSLPYNYLADDEKSTDEVTFYHELISHYITSIIDDLDSQQKLKIQKSIIYSTSSLAALLFAKCLDIFKKEEINQIAVFETCVSFAQGITQIMENAMIHPPKESDSIAFFSFRFQTKNKRANTISEYYYLFPPQWNSKLLIEFSVSDVALEESKAKGIIEQFKYNNSLADDIKIKDLFEFSSLDTSKIYKVFSNPSKIANHYGLQIFSNIVSENNGFFRVISDGEGYFGNLDSEREKKTKDTKDEAFKGTTYTIVCPIDVSSFEPQSYNGIANTSTHNLSVNSIPDYKTILLNDKDIYRILGSINIKQSIMSERMYSVITSKKDSIISSACKIFQKAYLPGSSAVNYVILCNLSYLEVELLCKVFFVILAQRELYNINHLSIQFANSSDCFYAARLFSLFYDRKGICRFVKDSAVLLYASGDNDHTQIFFSGKDLKEAFNGLKNQYVNGCLRQNLYNHAKAIIGKRDFDSLTSTEFISDIVSKHCIADYKTGQKLICQELIQVLNNDVHDKNKLGCKISNTHIRVSGVHLDTFYEAQFLFGNTYWCNAFAVYLFIRIKNYLASSSCNDPIVLYGYELYSADVMYKTKEMLHSVLKRDVYLLFYENGDPGEDTNRVRYIDDLTNCDNALFFYFVGISSTLSTFNRMHKALQNEMSSHEIYCDYSDVKCYSIIQIIGNDATCRKYIKLVESDKTNRVYSNKKHLDFLPCMDDNRYSEYMVAAISGWHEAGNCVCCNTQNKSTLFNAISFRNSLEEKALIEVNEASVVPTMLYDKGNDAKQGITKPIFDIKPIKGGEYVYCDHVERNGNHYQYYLRLSKLYRDYRKEVISWLDKLSKSAEYRSWFNEIINPNYINIIVSPHQYSKNSFVDDVNSIIFNGGAHTIIFDVNKEYRKNFIAKYDFFAKSIKDNSKEIRLFYVTDQIVSGHSFFRAKSLASSLFEMWDSTNVFYGIFVLLNRNSDYSIRSLIKSNNEKLPYFSFIDLYIPSLRINYDSCPICNKIINLKNAFLNCTLNPIAELFQDEIVYLRVKNIRTVHSLYSGKGTIDTYNNLDAKKLYKYNFERLQCENYLWKIIKLSTNPVFILICICKMLRTNHIESCRRLKFFIDSLSQPLLFYRESIKLFVLPFLVELFYEIVYGFLNEQKDFFNVSDFLNYAYHLPENECVKLFNVYASDYKDENLKEHSLLALLFDNKIVYDEKLLDVLISVIRGLGNIGSNILLNADCISKCYRISKLTSDKTGRKLKEALVIAIKYIISCDKDKSCYIDYLNDSVVCKNPSSSKALELSDVIADQYLKNKENDAELIQWLSMLYLESFSYSFDNDSVETWIKNYKNDTVQNKYQAIVDRMKAIHNEEINQIDLQICVDHESEEYSSIISDDREIKYESIKPNIEKYGFYVDSSKIYIKISNNYSPNRNISIFEWESLFGSSKRIDAVLVIDYKPSIEYLDKLKISREIMIYKNLLVQNLSRDFEENIFSQYFINKKIIKQFRSTPLCTHRGSVLSGFTEYLGNINPSDSELYFSIIKHYANILITFSNIGRTVGTVPEGLRISNCPDPKNIVLENVNRIIQHFKNIYGEKRITDNFIDFKKKLSQVIYSANKTSTSGNVKPYVLSLTNETTAAYDLSALLYIFLENAVSHGDENDRIDIVFSYVSKYKTFNLSIHNKVKKNDSHNRGITLNSIKYLFDKYATDDGRPTPKFEKSNDEVFFNIEIKNIILIA